MESSRKKLIGRSGNRSCQQKLKVIYQIAGKQAIRLRCQDAKCSD